MHQVLPDGLHAARAARTMLASSLAGRPDLDDVVLATSELVANAVEHGAPPVELHVDTGPRGLRVTVVCGHTGGRPVPREASDEDDGGRGLALVARLARDWGWEIRSGRMHVWAEFGSPDD